MTASPKTPARRNRAKIIVESITGLRYVTLFATWAGMTVGFALVYLVLSYAGDGGHGPTQMQGMDFWHRLYNALYYSIITATSTGYGDIVPIGFSKVIASLQSILSLFVFAFFVTKLVAYRQELTIMEVHRLTFEDVFHNSREGMFIARKDFDHVIHNLEDYGTMEMEHWENLVIAYRQLQTLFEEIPDFYENDTHRYTIDRKREELLLEAVHRTLHRINQMLDLMSMKGVDWFVHEQSVRELKELVRIVADVTPVWQDRSPYGLHEAFEDILQMKERVHLKMLNAIKD